MNDSTTKPSPSNPDPGAKAPPMLHEGDIGSGEISPGQHETNEMIKQIPPLPSNGGQDGDRDPGAAPQDGQAASQP